MQKGNDRERRAENEKRSVEERRGKLWKRMRDSVDVRSLSAMQTKDRVECSQLSVDSLSCVCDDESIESSIAQVSWQRHEQTCRWHNRGHENVIIQSNLSATIAGMVCLFDWSERRLSKALDELIGFIVSWRCSALLSPLMELKGSLSFRLVFKHCNTNERRKRYPAQHAWSSAGFFPLLFLFVYVCVSLCTMRETLE